VKDTNPSRWHISIGTYLASFTFGLSLQSLPPVLPILIQDLDLTHAEAGLTMSAFALPMVFFSIPVGMLADRQGPRRVGLTAFVVIILGNILAAVSPAFPVLLAGRALAGMGAFALALISPQLISQRFLGRELGLAMGIWNTAFPIATILSLTTMGTVGQVLGWRSPLFIAAAAAAVCLIVFWLTTSSVSAPKEPPQTKVSFSSRIAGAGAPVWFVGAAWLFFNASTLSFMTFGPDYFQSRGQSAAEAGVMSSIMLWGFVLAPAVGMLLDRGVRPEALIALGSLGLTIALVVLPLAPTLVVPILLLGAVVNSLIVVSVFALPSTLLRPGLLGLGYGILGTCLNLGTTLGPLVVGAAIDVTGAYTASLWAMALLALLAAGAITPMIVWRRPAPGLGAAQERVP